MQGGRRGLAGLSRVVTARGLDLANVGDLVNHQVVEQVDLFLQ